MGGIRKVLRDTRQVWEVTRTPERADRGTPTMSLMVMTHLTPAHTPDAGGGSAPHVVGHGRPRCEVSVAADASLPLSRPHPPGYAWTQDSP